MLVDYPPIKLERIRNILTAFMVADSLNDLPALPGWRLHRLTGDRRGRWSLSVTGNWRLTFELDGDDIYNMKLTDYH